MTESSAGLHIENARMRCIINFNGGGGYFLFFCCFCIYNFYYLPRLHTTYGGVAHFYSCFSVDEGSCRQLYVLSQNYPCWTHKLALLQVFHCWLNSIEPAAKKQRVQSVSQYESFRSTASLFRRSSLTGSATVDCFLLGGR